ncbi:MAG: hypothetical protein J4G13_04600 [Dehalococcoidia bacterium]|nr:hypothetical protein [Dehalococcoidia bacterium]
MEVTLTPWQLTGIVIAAVVGITTIISLLIASGIRIGKFVTRDDLDRTSDKLEKKIDDEIAGLQKKIDDNNESVLSAIQNLGTRLEDAILEHTHDEEGVAVFRRHPQLDAAD